MENPDDPGFEDFVLGAMDISFTSAFDDGTTVKDNCNPTYDETFEYLISQPELLSRQLEVTVLTQKTWKSPVMGQVIVNFSDFDLSKATTQWFDLKPGTEA